jgi:hypothetical protein
MKQLNKHKKLYRLIEWKHWAGRYKNIYNPHLTDEPGTYNEEAKVDLLTNERLEEE